MTLFTKIAKGEIPSYKIAEDSDFYAFLDISPMTKGHTLVIPKHTEEDYIFRLDDETYEGLMKFAKRVAQAIEKAMDCKRVGVMVLGLEVPHTHIHLVPINKEGDMNISNPKLKLSPEEMTEIATRIENELK
jgi:histidine triad (HIT) family protein